MSSSYRNWSSILAFTALIGLFVLGYWMFNVAAAQQGADRKDASQSQPDNAGKESEPNDDPYAVPDAEPKELLEFIETIRELRPDAKSGISFYDHLRKVHASIIQAAEKILAAETDDATAIAAVQAKFASYRLLLRLGDQSAVEKARQFGESLKNDPRPEIVAEATMQRVLLQIPVIGSLKDKQREKLLADVLKLLNDGEMTQLKLRLGVMMASSLEQSGDTQLAAKAYTQLGQLLADSEDANAAALGAKLQGAARRVQLLGKPLELTGETVDGDPFDWNAYRGKVVLVDFWATWCGPCVAEMPNVKKNYERYRDRGFDVVGISLDNDKEDLLEFLDSKEIPWITLFSLNADSQGWDHPMATYYGVMGIPTVILVDREGKAVSLTARGRELDRLLAEMIGPPVVEDASDAADSEEKDSGTE